MRKCLLILICVLLLLPAAASAGTIVTSFYPVWLLTRSLTDGLEGVSVKNLAAPETGCLHDYSLRPSDMASLSRADALLINGAGMESFLPVIVSACPDLVIIDASEGIDTESLPEAVEIGSGHDHGHDHEHDHDHDGEEEEEEEENSHLWLDPARASCMAENLARGLIRLFPEQAGRITANLQALQGRLADLSAELAEGLQDIPCRDVILFHEAFPFFAEACRLNTVAVVEKESDDSLTTSMLVTLVRFIRDCDTPPLIIKSRETDPYMPVLEAETGVRFCELDPLTSGPDDPAPDYYETVMRGNLRLLRDCLPH